MPFDYSIVIPAFNEAPTLVQAVRELVSFCARQPKQIEILLVENGSTDETWLLAQTLSRDLNLRALRCPCKGKGAAILHGWKNADAPIVLFLDADLSPSLETLPSLYKAVLKTGGCAVADRFLPESRVHRSLVRELFSRSWAHLASMSPPLPFMDYQCGAKALRADLVAMIECETQARDWFFDIDFLCQLYGRGIPIERVPVLWEECVFNERRSHLPLFQTSWRFLRGLHQLRRRLHPARSNNSGRSGRHRQP